MLIFKIGFIHKNQILKVILSEFYNIYLMWLSSNMSFPSSFCLPRTCSLRNFSWDTRIFSTLLTYTGNCSVRFMFEDFNFCKESSVCWTFSVLFRIRCFMCFNLVFICFISSLNLLFSIMSWIFELICSFDSLNRTYFSITRV